MFQPVENLSICFKKIAIAFISSPRLAAEVVSCKK
jgi:hypothetical protein